MDVALDGGEHDATLAAVALDLLHVRLEVGDRRLHGLGRLQHERQLHLARAEQVAHHLHAGEQHVVDDAERGEAPGERLVEVGLDAVAVAVDDALAEAVLDGPVGAVLLLGDHGLHVGEDVEQLGERVVVGVAARQHALGATAVVDQVHAHVALLVGDAVERQDLGGVDDGRVEAGLRALVEEHRVEDVPRRRVEAERHVRQAQRGVDARQVLLDEADALDGLDAVAAALLDAGGEGERQGVEDEVGRLEAVALDGEVVDLLGGPELPVAVAGLALLVDAGAHHGRAVVAGERQELVEAGAGRVAVLEVDGVEDGPAADPLQRGLDHVGLGGVDHQRRVHLRGEAAGDLLHVGGTVAAHVVDAHVEDVGAFLDLLGGHLEAGVPVAVDHVLAELLRAVGVGALADAEERGVLVERDGRVDRRGRRLVHRVARGHLDATGGLDEPGDELGGGAAAAAHDLHAEVGDEAGLVGDEVLGGEVVVHGAVDDARQPGVGQAGDRDAAVLAEVAEVLAHLGRARGAVDADDVDVQRVDGREGRADLGAEQHAAGELHGDLRLDGHLPAGRGHGPTAADDGGLHGEEVEVGLEEEQVDAALEQRGGLDLVGVAQLDEADLPEAGRLGARAHGAGHEALAVGCGEVVGDLPGDAGVGEGDLVGPVGHAVLAERDGEGAEGVRLDHVGADLEVRRVQRGHRVGPGDGEVLVAALEGLTAEVVGGQVLGLQPGARGAVVHDDTLGNQVEEGRGHGRAGYWQVTTSPKCVAGTFPIRPPRFGCTWRCPGTAKYTQNRHGHGGEGGGANVAGMKIYTRKGDDGTTGLLYGGRVRKDSARPTAYGTVDEAQAALGVARAQCMRGGELDEVLVALERDLWVLMAEMATAPGQPAQAHRGHEPGHGRHGRGARGADRRLHRPLRAAHRVRRPRPGPGGRPARRGPHRGPPCRARRAAVDDEDHGDEPSQVTPYLNRLSDLVWTLARWQEANAGEGSLRSRGA